MTLEVGTERLSRNVVKQLGSGSLTLWDGTDRLSRNVSKELSLYAA
jgi:hypothetical protein